MTYLEAKESAQAILTEEYKTLNAEIVIDENSSLRFSRGWVFAYNSEEFIKNPLSTNYLMVTNPILVDRIDGNVLRLYDIDKSIDDPYELIEFYEKSKL